jgi:hypothetical protein
MVMTLGAFARRHGVSVQAVSKAVRRGRLARSILKDARGVPCIASVELADAEWAAAGGRSKLPPPRVIPAVQTSAQRPPAPLAPVDLERVVVSEVSPGLMALGVTAGTDNELDPARDPCIVMRTADAAAIGNWLTDAALHALESGDDDDDECDGQ